MTRLLVSLAVASTLAFASFAGAVEVEVSVSPRETQVGLPITLTIVIENAESYDLPRIPSIDGATIGTPGSSRRSETNIIQGRTTRREFITLTYPITPSTAGTITIPGFEVTADGKTFDIDPVEVIVHDVGSSATMGDEDVELLEAEMTAKRGHVYLGEPVELTLHIWVRPYHDSRHDITLSDRDMWGLFNRDASRWGPFTAELSEYVSRRQLPPVREMLRPDGAGNRRAYFRYELTAKAWPRQAGPLVVDPVSIVIDYPTRLDRRRRTIFSGNELVVGRSRTLVVRPETPAVEVLAPPIEGQPPTFAGAVGEFTISATAKPTEVAVGDPITVTMTITDRTPGGSELELLQPPPLDRVESITQEFRVPTDLLAGVVQGKTKTFTQTIRARNDAVDRVPAIPFSFFRPGVEKYETVWSASIPILVEPAGEMAMTEVVEAGGNGRTATTELTSVAGGLLANYTEHDVLLASQKLELRWWTWLLFAAPPLVFVTAAVSQRRVLRLRHDTAYVRRRTARRNAIQAIGRASDATAGVQARAEHLAAAVTGYVADRCNLPSGALTRAEIAERLRTASVEPALVDQVETVLSRCEQCCYAASADGDLDELIRSARSAIDRLEREHIG